MRRARSVKTCKAVAKRFKITATGKVLRKKAGHRHLLSSKRPKRKRKMRKDVPVADADAHRVLESLPFV